MVQRLCAAMYDALAEWHCKGLAFFPLPGSWEDEVEDAAIKLAHANYQGWHAIKLYNRTDPALVEECNARRCALREKLDHILCRQQRGTGKPATESIGCAMDRLSILIIKSMHIDSGDIRRGQVLRERAFLERAVLQLWDDMLAGRRCCFPQSAFKIDYHEEGG